MSGSSQATPDTRVSQWTPGSKRKTRRRLAAARPFSSSSLTDRYTGKSAGDMPSRPGWVVPRHPGPALDAFTDEVGRVAGEGVRARMEALAILDVVEVRPILDMGQGWERSI